MAETDWRELLDDPEITGIIGRIRNGPGLRMYRPTELAFDDLESWLWDRAVDIAQAYTTSGRELYDPARHWRAWLYTSLKNDLLRGIHFRSLYGRPDTARRAAETTALSIEEATEQYGDNLMSRIHEAGAARAWRDDPVTVLVTIERLERLAHRAETMPRRAFTVESGGICSMNLCLKPVHTISSGLCAAHYQQERKYRDDCSVAGCDQGAHSQGLCQTHWRHHREADPDVPRCDEDGCERAVYSRKVCRAHYQQLRVEGGERWNADYKPKVCVVPGCDRGGRLRKGMCEPHYRGRRAA